MFAMPTVSATEIMLIWYHVCKFRCTSWLRILNPRVARLLVNLVLSREDPLLLPLRKTLMVTCLSLFRGPRHLSLFAKSCFVLVTLSVLSSSMRRYFLSLCKGRLFQKLEMLNISSLYPSSSSPSHTWYIIWYHAGPWDEAPKKEGCAWL